MITHTQRLFSTFFSFQENVSGTKKFGIAIFQVVSFLIQFNLLFLQHSKINVKAWNNTGIAPCLTDQSGYLWNIRAIVSTLASRTCSAKNIAYWLLDRTGQSSEVKQGRHMCTVCTLHLCSKVCLMDSRFHLHILHTCWFLYCKPILHCNASPRYIVHK